MSQSITSSINTQDMRVSRDRVLRFLSKNFVLFVLSYFRQFKQGKTGFLSFLALAKTSLDQDCQSIIRIY